MSCVECVRRMGLALHLLPVLVWGIGCTSKASVRPGINDEYQRVADVEKWVERFEGESREIYRSRDAIVAAAGLRPGECVADIGAGTGLFTLPFARQVLPNGVVYAVDIAPEFLKLIGERAAREGLPNVRTIRCRDDSTDLPDGSIDVAFVCDTYHHFEYPRATLASIHRAMRPGGRLIVIDFERIEGQSREWVLNHVRAGREVFTAEIVAAGFMPVDGVARPAGLQENYFLVFRRDDAPPATAAKQP